MTGSGRAPGSVRGRKYGGRRKDAEVYGFVWNIFTDRSDQKLCKKVLTITLDTHKEKSYGSGAGAPASRLGLRPSARLRVSSSLG